MPVGQVPTPQASHQASQARPGLGPGQAGPGQARPWAKPGQSDPIRFIQTIFLVILNIIKTLIKILNLIDVLIKSNVLQVTAFKLQ